MAIKFFHGENDLGQVTSFDMSLMPDGALALPVNAVRNLSEISSEVKLDLEALPVEGGSKLVVEKHLKAVEAAAQAANDAMQAIIEGEIDRLDLELGSATSDRAAIRSEFAAEDTAIRGEFAAADATLQGNIDTVSAGLAQELLDRAALPVAQIPGQRGTRHVRPARCGAPRGMCNPPGSGHQRHYRYS